MMFDSKLKALVVQSYRDHGDLDDIADEIEAAQNKLQLLRVINKVLAKAGLKGQVHGTEES